MNRILAAILLLTSFILNAKVTGIYLLAVMLIHLLERKWSPRTSEINMARFFAFYNFIWVTIAASTYICFYLLDLTETIIFSWAALLLGLAANTFLVFWWKVRRLLSAAQEATDFQIFNNYILYFIVFSISAIGLGLFTLQGDDVGQLGYLFREASFNLATIAIVLLVGLVILMSTWLLKYNKQLSFSLIRVGFAAIFLWTCTNYLIEIGSIEALHQQLFDQHLLEVRISDLISQPGVAAYESEILYYQGVANEFREQLLAPSISNP